MAHNTVSTSQIEPFHDKNTLTNVDLKKHCHVSVNKI